MTESDQSPVHILFVENDAGVVERAVASLHEGGIPAIHRSVKSEDELRAALQAERWDVVICDDELPGLDGFRALRLAKELVPTTPFILLSGTPGEEAAVDAIRAGAEDYVLKRNLTRLASAVRREVRETKALPRASGNSPSDPLFFLSEVKDYAIYMIDTSGNILTWNEGARLIKGYSAEEIIGQNFARFFTEQDRANGKPAALLRAAVAEGRVEDEAWRIRKDGTLFWADVVITAIHDERGRHHGFVKVTRDLTERVNTEEMLRQSEERLRLLVESVNDYAIFMLDPDGKVATWNSGAQRIKGYRANEVVGKHFSIFYPPEHAHTDRPERELRIAATEGRYQEEGWRIRKNGERFWASVVLTAIRGPVHGELRGFAKVTRDLTERQRLEQRTQAATEEAGKERARALEAQSALQMREEFISVAAHELRTPLTALQLKIEGVRQGLVKARAQSDLGHLAKAVHRLEGALRQVERLSELVERLLDVSRIVQGKLAMTFEESDLSSLVAHVLEDFREPAYQTGSELRFHQPGEIVGVWDKARLEQVVVNLVSNAIKYGAGKPIDIKVEATDGRVRLIVTDQGIGIGDADLERIFGRFERAASARHYSGMGLGLYVTRNIVEAHGGTVRAASRSGEGSTFVVDLPRRPAGDQSVASPMEPKT